MIKVILLIVNCSGVTIATKPDEQRNSVGSYMVAPLVDDEVVAAAVVLCILMHMFRSLLLTP